jgi:hypothetical protein
VNLPAISGAAYARVSYPWGWMADCPARYCRSALKLERFQPVYECMDCPEVAAIIWPPFAEDVERLLMMRPDPVTWNWNPGETLHDLLWENSIHGVLTAPTGVESGPVLSIVGDRIELDALTAGGMS